MLTIKKSAVLTGKSEKTIRHWLGKIVYKTDAASQRGGIANRVTSRFSKWLQVVQIIGE